MFCSIRIKERAATEEATNKLLRHKNGFRPQAHNLASIVRGFKASFTTEARRQGLPFEWVSRYHDSILRTVGDLFFVRSYIQTNVERWEGGINLTTFSPHPAKFRHCFRIFGTPNQFYEIQVFSLGAVSFSVGAMVCTAKSHQ